MERTLLTSQYITRPEGKLRNIAVKIIGINNIFDEINPEIALEKKEIIAMFKNIPLHNGLYKIKVLLAGESFLKLYDLSILQNAFRIFSENKIEGLIKIEHEWK